jgi:hypothetical protein
MTLQRFCYESADVPPGLTLAEHRYRNVRRRQRSPFIGRSIRSAMRRPDTPRW